MAGLGRRTPRAAAIFGRVSGETALPVDSRKADTSSLRRIPDVQRMGFFEGVAYA